jgi:anti-sigma B factor antagonist
MTTRDILTVHSEVTSTLCTVVACGEVDLTSAPLLRDELLRQLRSGARVRLHLAGVTFMDSSGLHVLLSTQRRASLLGAAFEVVDLSPPVRRLLQVSGVERILTVAAEPSTASAEV